MKEELFDHNLREGCLASMGPCIEVDTLIQVMSTSPFQKAVLIQEVLLVCFLADHMVERIMTSFQGIRDKGSTLA